MKYRQLDNKFILRFDHQDDFKAEFLRFCNEASVEAGSYSGIGSFANCQLGYFDLGTKSFQKIQITENYEVASLIGNLTRLENKAYLHTHVTLGGKNFNTKAGHLCRATIGATLEMVFEKITGKLSRRFSDEIGLNLIDV